MLTVEQLRERTGGNLDDISDERLQKRNQFLTNTFNKIIDDYFTSLLNGTNETKGQESKV